MPACPACGYDTLDIDVKCGSCGAALGASGAHRMIGQVMLGVYELVDVLGQGGMSVVFKGRHKLTEQEVALKILPPELAAHSQVKSRFLEEAKALAALDHPNIVHLYNFGQENGYFVLAMQFVAGKTWERLILGNQRLDWPASCRIAIDVLRALEYAHGRGVVHRDMKPSNVLVREHDGSATVMDFGIAKMTTSTRLTATGQTMGTVRYMSPEQVRGQEVDYRTDIYGLGATLYESLTGETPFDGNTHFEIMTKHLSDAPKRPSHLGIELPRTVEDALVRSLAKRAIDRFDSAREMRKVLEQALVDNDLGLVETQKLGRGVLGDLRQTPKSVLPMTPQPQRLATASDLADELEPSDSTTRQRSRRVRKRSVVPWIALGVLVAGGSAGLALMLRQRDGYAPVVDIPGVSLVAGQTVGRVLIETDRAVTPEEVGKLYQTALAGLLAYAVQKQLELPAEDPIQQLVAMPQAALCSPGAYLFERPANCASATFATTIGPQGVHRLYVIADRAQLPDAIRRGVAQAVCEFTPVDRTTEAGAKRFAEICNLTRSFVEAGIQ